MVTQRDEDNPSFGLVPLDRVTATPVEWIWRGFVQRGAVTILEGDPGTGKSAIMRDIASRITSGFPMPGESKGATEACVILLQSEDALANVQASLIAMRATMSRVMVPDKALLRLPDDLPLIEDAGKHWRPRIVVIDPLSGFTTALSASEARARECLERLAQFAERTATAVIIVRHFKKGDGGRAIHRGIGSIAASAVARSVLAIADCPEKHHHVLVQTKSNVCSDAPPLEYRTVRQGEAVVIEWLGPSEKSLEELLGSTTSDPTAREEAAKVLFGILEKGPVPSREVYKSATAAGIAKRTLDRAKRELGVKSRKSGSGRDSRWFWQLPDRSEVVSLIREKAHNALCNELFHGAVVLDDSRIEPGSRPKKKGDNDEAVPTID
jgi:hypothetical protein